MDDIIELLLGKRPIESQEDKWILMSLSTKSSLTWFKISPCTKHLRNSLSLSFSVVSEDHLQLPEQAVKICLPFSTTNLKVTFSSSISTKRTYYNESNAEQIGKSNCLLLARH